MNGENSVLTCHSLGVQQAKRRPDALADELDLTGAVQPRQPLAPGTLRRLVDRLR